MNHPQERSKNVIALYEAALPPNPSGYPAWACGHLVIDALDDGPTMRELALQGLFRQAQITTGGGWKVDAEGSLDGTDVWLKNPTGDSATLSLVEARALGEELIAAADVTEQTSPVAGDGEGDRWEHVGTIGVDTGSVMIGDPCYTQGKDAPGAVATWREFVERTYADATNDTWPSVASVLGDEGLGLVVQSGYGDGSYPVSVRRAEDGYIAELRVVFISEVGMLGNVVPVGESAVPKEVRP